MSAFRSIFPKQVFVVLIFCCGTFCAQNFKSVKIFINIGKIFKNGDVISSGSRIYNNETGTIVCYKDSFVTQTFNIKDFFDKDIAEVKVEMKKFVPPVLNARLKRIAFVELADASGKVKGYYYTNNPNIVYGINLEDREYKKLVLDELTKYKFNITDEENKLNYVV